MFSDLMKNEHQKIIIMKTSANRLVIIGISPLIDIERGKRIILIHISDGI